MRMFVFGGVGDANAYREDLWYLYIGTRAAIEQFINLKTRPLKQHLQMYLLTMKRM
jgi:hypothetical protein